MRSSLSRFFGTKKRSDEGFAWGSNRKAIHTTENNSIMGRYFRRRLRIPLGERVYVQDVLNYDRTSVRVYKIDSETYFMDFGVGFALTEVW